MIGARSVSVPDAASCRVARKTDLVLMTDILFVAPGCSMNKVEFNQMQFPDRMGRLASQGIGRAQRRRLESRSFVEASVLRSRVLAAYLGCKRSRVQIPGGPTILPQSPPNPTSAIWMDTEPGMSRYRQIAFDPPFSNSV